MPSTLGTPLEASPELDSPNQTYDQAVDLGDVRAVPEITRHGFLGAGVAGAGDVEWYRFVLDRPARVLFSLAGSQPDSSFRGILSLYNDSLDPFGDYTNALSVRRLTSNVADDVDGIATIDWVIGPGTYNLAVSGAGNDLFSPVVAHTGLPGSTGDFDLSVRVVDAGFEASDGPRVVSTDPAPNALLTASPFAIRIGLSASLDPSTVARFLPEPSDQPPTLWLNYSSDGTFDDEAAQSVPLASLVFSDALGELQLAPQGPLAPGFYELILSGDSAGGRPVLTGLDGKPLGLDAQNPTGRDFVLRFRVVGIEGRTNLDAPADDTPAGARDLGELTTTGFVRADGAIGDDPFYNNDANNPIPDSYDPLYNPGNDVDLYHFRVTGPGRYVFSADVFAGRIGSYLSPRLNLFRVNAETQTLDPVDIDSANYNFVPPGPSFYSPRYYDATMSGGLTAGDYYLAVSSLSFSTLDLAGSHTFRDGGYSSGPYVLNLLLRPTEDDAPRVVETNLTEGRVFTQAPIRLAVKFDHLVNLPILVFSALEQTGNAGIDAVTIRAEGGTVYHPYLQSYDYTTNIATFLIFDHLRNGRYTLHVSGSQGLGDLGGQPLVGNDPGGDHVVSFTVNEATRGATDDPTRWTVAEPNDDMASSQSIGALFPSQLLWSTDIERAPGADPDHGPADRADVFRFQVGSNYTLRFMLLGNALPEGRAFNLTLRNESGEELATTSVTDEGYLFADVEAGTYFIEVNGWNPDEAGAIAYRLSLGAQFFGRWDSLGLMTSPAPAVAIQLSRGALASGSESSMLPDPDGGEDFVGYRFPADPNDKGSGHDAPPLPTPPSPGGAIVIDDAASHDGGSGSNQGHGGPPSGSGSLPSGGVLSLELPFLAKERPPAGLRTNLSTSYSVLGFQPLGGVGRVAEEPATPPGRVVSEAIIPSPAPFGSTQGATSGLPTLVGIAPPLPLELATSPNVVPPLGPANAGAAHPAGPLGLMLQAPVPWAPDPRRLDARQGDDPEGPGEPIIETKRAGQPIVTEAAERNDVPEPRQAGNPATPAPTLTPAPKPETAPSPDASSAPEPAEPVAAVDSGSTGLTVAVPTVAAKAAEIEDGEGPGPRLDRETGAAILGVAGCSLSVVAYLRNWGPFKVKWFSRSSLGRAAAGRRVSEPARRPLRRGRSIGRAADLARHRAQDSHAEG